MTDASIHIYFDGGSKNNQSASSRQGYGSFKAQYNGQYVAMTLDRGKRSERKTGHARIEFGNATNNEAEWKTLIIALSYALDVQSNSGERLKFFFHGDSQNVLGPFIDGSKVKAANLKPLYEQAKALAEVLDAGFVKETGETIKSILGH